MKVQRVQATGTAEKRTCGLFVVVDIISFVRSNQKWTVVLVSSVNARQAELQYIFLMQINWNFPSACGIASQSISHVN